MSETTEELVERVNEALMLLDGREVDYAEMHEAWLNGGSALRSLRTRLERYERVLREIAELSGMVNTEQPAVLMARAALSEPSQGETRDG